MGCRPFACLILAGCSSAASAQPIETAQTLPSARQQAYGAYVRVLPEAFAGAAWIRRLDGTSEPLQIVKLGGRDYALGFSCQPHDCGANALAFLAALDGSRAVVMVKSDEHTAGTLEVYGQSSPAERTQLKELLDLPR